MSIRVIAWVWESSQAEGTDRLVLLALADQARDDGSAWPSVKTIAAKAKVSERTVQRSIRALMLLGELSTDPNAGMKGTNLYTVRMSPRQDDTPDIVTPVSLAPVVTPVTRRGDTPVTRTVKNLTSPQPPATAGAAGPLDHCRKHSRFRRACDDCTKAQTDAKAKPPWCGHCDERTRLRDFDGGKPHRCPECHPLKTDSERAS